ncbi:hypothetical protein E2I00_015793, partial [Balaenoptera physalus]
VELFFEDQVHRFGQCFIGTGLKRRLFAGHGVQCVPDGGLIKYMYPDFLGREAFKTARWAGVGASGVFGPKSSSSINYRNGTRKSPRERTRSLHGPCPVTTFGPKACVLQNPQTIMHIQDPASQRLTWSKSPKSVLVIKKIRDASLLQPFKELCVYLMEENNMIVYVEKKVLEDPAIVSDDRFGPGSVPPVMAFHLGSLGFLTPFNFENFQSQVTQVIQGNAAVVLRSRLKVRVVKELRGKKVAVPNGISENGVLAAALDAEVGKQVMQYQIMLSPEARNTVWVSFDGRKRQEVRHGD